jgi:hypothetical protein
MHPAHWQVPGSHVAVPPLPQGIVAFGAQTPPPVQAPQADHIPVVLSQVRVCVPQLPQPCEAVPLHTWFPHALHWQLPPHD